MARTPKNETAPTVAATSGATLADLVLSAGPHTVRYADLPEKTRVRMAQKAFNELLNDSTAMSKDQKDKIRAKAIDTGADPEKAVAAELDAKRDARFNSLLTGEFSTAARGPRGSKLETIERAVAIERIKAAWANAVTAGKIAKGTPFPKGDKLDEFVARQMAKAGDEIKAEVARRMAAPASVDVDDVLGL